MLQWQLFFLALSSWLNTSLAASPKVELDTPHVVKLDGETDTPYLVFWHKDAELVVPKHNKGMKRQENGGIVPVKLADGSEAVLVGDIKAHPQDQAILYADLTAGYAISGDLGQTWQLAKTPEQKGDRKDYGKSRIEIHSAFPQCAIFQGHGASSPTLACLGKDPVHLDGAKACVFGNSEDKMQLVCVSDNGDLTITVDAEKSTQSRIIPDAPKNLNDVLRSGKYFGALSDSIYISTGLSEWHELVSCQDKNSQVSWFDANENTLLVVLSSPKDPKVAELWAADSRGRSLGMVGRVSDREHHHRHRAAIERAEHNRNVVLAEMNDAYGDKFSARSTNGGRTWTQVKEHLHINPNNDLHQRALNPVPGVFFALCGARTHRQSTLCVSKDMAATWEKAPYEISHWAVGDSGSIVLGAPHREHTKQPLIRFNVANGTWAKVETKSYKQTHFVPSVYCSPNSALCYVYQHNSGVYSLDWPNESSICSKDDFELKTLGPESCFNGKSQNVLVRKPGVVCQLGPGILDPSLKHTFDVLSGSTSLGPFEGDVCLCAINDYECDMGFVWNTTDHTCWPTKPIECKDKETVVTMSGGYIKQLNNQCKADNSQGLQLLGDHQWKCKTKERVSGSGMMDGGDCGDDKKGSNDKKNNDVKAGEKWHINSSVLDSPIVNYAYLDRMPDSDGETVFIWTRRGSLYISRNGGASWDKSEITGVVNIWHHHRDQHFVYIYTDKGMLHSSNDQGKSFKSSALPGIPLLRGRLIDIHHEHPDWLIAHTLSSCKGSIDSCPIEAYVSKNAGQSWSLMTSNIERCFWVSHAIENSDENLVFCAQRQDQSHNVTLNSSHDYFAKQTTTLINDVYGVQVDPPFVVAAVVDSDKKLAASVSYDGVHFALAKLPDDINLAPMTRYTVINVRDDALVIHAATSTQAGFEFGALLKSDFDGVRFARMLDNVNRNNHGFVDYERAPNLDGLAWANVVTNPEEVRAGAGKKLRTVFTHSDGAFWGYVPAPDSKEDPEKMSLNLHGYSERHKGLSNPSSPSAVGVLLGLGNTGTELTEIETASTFMSTDAGLSWKKLSDKAFFWEFGDSGSLILLAPRHGQTNSVFVSDDEGANLKEIKISDTPVEILYIATMPSDTSLNFVLFARTGHGPGQEHSVIQVNFDNYFEKQCDFKGPESETDDFEFWEPAHPTLGADACLFGQHVKYLRKIAGRQCYIGDLGMRLGNLKKLIKSCPCTEKDFECDHNFVRNENNGKCELVPGASVPSKDDQCRDGAIAWRESTGYRRVSINKCEGGKELDKGGRYNPCPGMEEPFSHRYDEDGRPRDRNGEPGRPDGPPGFGPPPPMNGGWGFYGLVKFFFIFAAIASVLSVGLLVALNYERTGEIRLGSSDREMLRSQLSTSGQTALLTVRQFWEQFMNRANLSFRGDSAGFYSHIGDDSRADILNDDEVEFDAEDYDSDVEALE